MDPAPRGFVHCADEMEDGIGCTAVPGASATGFSMFGSHVPCRGAGYVVRAVKEGLGQPGRRQDDACESWLGDAFQSSVDYLVGSAHCHL